MSKVTTSYARGGYTSKHRSYGIRAVGRLPRAQTTTTQGRVSQGYTRQQGGTRTSQNGYYPTNAGIRSTSQPRRTSNHLSANQNINRNYFSSKPEFEVPNEENNGQITSYQTTNIQPIRQSRPKGKSTLAEKTILTSSPRKNIGSTPQRVEVNLAPQTASTRVVRTSAGVSYGQRTSPHSYSRARHASNRQVSKVQNAEFYTSKVQETIKDIKAEFERLGIEDESIFEAIELTSNEKWVEVQDLKAAHEEEEEDRRVNTVILLTEDTITLKQEIREKAASIQEIKSVIQEIWVKTNEGQEIAPQEEETVDSEAPEENQDQDGEEGEEEE